jgi:tetratricopeptide (TPR) repeat protein
MGGFTRALGVRCSHCHVGEEGQPLATYDFASDSVELKRKARAMLRMVQAINGEHLAGLPSRVDPPVRVECVTCHGGRRVPRTLQDELRLAYAAGGLDALVARYDSLRAAYHGRAAYDFAAYPVTEVADELIPTSLADAEAVHTLGLRYNPDDALARTRYIDVALRRAFLESGAAAGVRRFRELVATYPDAVTEALVNRSGYAVLRGGNPAAAVALFRLNAEAHPRSGNVHDSLGEALMAAGEREAAIASYRRSLELDPSNDNAREKLRELGAGG